jgi:hypothetical protein
MIQLVVTSMTASSTPKAWLAFEISVPGVLLPRSSTGISKTSRTRC